MNCRSGFRTFIWPTITGAVLLAVAGEIVAAAAVERIPVTGKIQWVYSYEEGQKVARATGKPMFIVFRCER